MSRLARLCALDDLAKDEANRFDVEGYRLAVVRIGDSVYAIADRCSHANYSLSEGELYPDELELECPQHGSTFNLVTGEPQSLPATTSVPTFAVTIDGDDVMVELP